MRKNYLKKRFFVRSLSFVLVCLMIAFFGVNASAEEESVKSMGWTFDTNNGGFFANNSTRSWEDGNLVQTIEGKNNSWLLSPSGLTIDTSVYKYLKVRVRNNTNSPATDKFSIEVTSSEKSSFTGTWTNFGTIPNDNEYHEYTVDLSECSDWTGTVNRFRLRVTDWNCTGNVYIDYIKFESPDPGEETRKVTINTPSDPCDLALGESIVLTTNVEGDIPSSVEYFVDGTSIGETTDAPYTLQWKPEESKGYYITSSATFSDKTITSKAIYLNVYDSSIVEESAYYWRFRGVTQGWAGNNSTISGTDETLIQEVEASKINSFLLSPSGLDIDASSYKYIKIRVKADFGQPGTLAVQWVTSEDINFDTSWTEGPKTYEVGKTAVSNDGLFHDYIIDLSNHEGWTGTVTRLRVKVTPWSDLGKMKATIDYIRVSNTLENGIDEDDVPKPSSIVTFETNEELKSFTVYKGAQYTDEVIKPESDGTYKLPAGLYTYTAEPASSSLCKVHQNFYITENDVIVGSKTIQLKHTGWNSPGYWQVKTMFIPPVEMTEEYFGDPIPNKELVTPSFEEGRRMNSFTTQEELEEYLAEIKETTSNMWMTNIGTSDNGLNIPLVVFSEGAQNNANWSSLEEAGSAVRELGKPVVWISGQTHGNEVSGGEAALQLIYELTTSWGDEVLDKVTVVVLPRQNPKGAMYNRRTPNGGNDINRDRIKLELQETQAINNAYWFFVPEVMIDAHEYGATPSLYQGKYTYAAYDLLISPANNCYVDDEIRSKSFTWYADPVKEKLGEYGIRGYDYYDGSLSGGMSENGSFRATQNTISSLYPSFAFLCETLIPGAGYNSMTHFERRVKSHLVSMQTVIEITADNSNEVKSLIDEKRSELLEKSKVYSEDNLVALYRESVPEMIDFDYIDMTTNEIKTAQITWNTYTRGYNTDLVTRPTGYIIPKTAETELAIERLRIMGAEIQELSASQVPTSNLQKYVVTSSKIASSLDQSVYKNTMTVNIENCQDATFENGAYLVSTSQIRSNLIIAALEPSSVLSYVTFRVIDVGTYELGDTLPYYRYTGDVEELLHTCDFDGGWYKNETHHWHECACGEIGELVEHEFTWAQVSPVSCTDDEVLKGVCVCGYETTKVGETALGHTYGEWASDETHHWHECACGEVVDKAEHYGGEATEEEKAVCQECGKSYGELKELVNNDKKEGCFGSVLTSLFGLFTLTGLTVVLRKKRKENN